MSEEEEKKIILYCPSCKKKTEAEETPLISGDSSDSLWDDYESIYKTEMLLCSCCSICKTRVYKKSAIKHYFFCPKLECFVRQFVCSAILWFCIYQWLVAEVSEEFFMRVMDVTFGFGLTPYLMALLFLYLYPLLFLLWIIGGIRDYNCLQRLLIERRATLKERQRHNPINLTSP